MKNLKNENFEIIESFAKYLQIKCKLQKWKIL